MPDPHATDLAALVAELPAGAGSIGLLSSDEFTRAARPFDDELLASARGLSIACVFCADHRHARMNLRNAARHFGFEVLDALGEHEPGRPVLREPDFDILYIAGGSPSDLLGCLRGSDAWRAIEERWRAGATLAGSSAGAMSLCAHSLAPRPGDDKPTAWTDGLGPITRFAVAVHASSRPRSWLERIAADAPVPVIALDDASGMILRPGKPPVTTGTVRAISL